MNSCTSTNLFGISQVVIALTFAGSICTPFALTITPRQSTCSFANLHFSGFRKRQFSFSIWRTRLTSSQCSSMVKVYIRISAIYTCTFPSTITSRKIAFIIVWNVAGEFVSPKNITVGLKRPSLVMKVAFSSSPSFILMLLNPHQTSIFEKILAP